MVKANRKKEKMKSIITSLVISATTALAVNPVLPPPTPPPAPQVSVSWDLPNAPVTNVFLWYGVGSGQYTNKTLVGNVSNTVVVLPARGVTYFFTVTMVYSNNQESAQSNEANYAPPTYPPAVMHPPVVLVVQNRPLADPSSKWSEFANFSLPADGPPQAYQLTITGNSAQAPPPASSVQQRAVNAMREVIARPPAPL
jgi:hypothetical protein